MWPSHGKDSDNFIGRILLTPPYELTLWLTVKEIFTSGVPSEVNLTETSGSDGNPFGTVGI